MDNELIIVEQSSIQGTVLLSGAKNAVLVSIASLLLTEGKSTLYNVPASDDIFGMIDLLQDLGAMSHFDVHKKILTVDTSTVMHYKVSAARMQKMRASILVLGPLLARFGKADVALPGGCIIGSRPIDYHIKNFVRMGVSFEQEDTFLCGSVQILQSKRLVLDYPSVGATENLLMAATLTKGVTTIVNAALEPEVLDLIKILRAMGAHINILAPATIEIEGVEKLHPVEHTVMVDRLEAGSLLLAAAVTGGSIVLPDANGYELDVFLMKLEEMGHSIHIDEHGKGISLQATLEPNAVSFKTSPYPGFPTDLQAPMMVAQCLAQGVSCIEETVFENRLVHVQALHAMGAHIEVRGSFAKIMGVKTLQGADVVASDIRAACALIIAGLAAKGTTKISGVHHIKRGYDALDMKLQQLGAKIMILSKNSFHMDSKSLMSEPDHHERSI